jgi:hypothetical protein
MDDEDNVSKPPDARMPVVFAAHGAPILIDDGVLVFGSGLLRHNRRFALKPGIPRWARELDARAASVGTPRTRLPITGWWMDCAVTRRSVQSD